MARIGCPTVEGKKHLRLDLPWQRLIGSLAGDGENLGIGYGKKKNPKLEL